MDQQAPGPDGTSWHAGPRQSGPGHGAGAFSGAGPAAAGGAAGRGAGAGDGDVFFRPAPGQVRPPLTQADDELFAVVLQARPVRRLVGVLLAQVSVLLRQVSGFLGLVGPLPHLIGEPPHLVGLSLGPVLVFLVGPVLGQIGRFLGQVGPFIGLIGGFPGQVGPLPGPVGLLAGEVRGLLSQERGFLRADLGSGDARRLGFQGVLLLRRYPGAGPILGLPFATARRATLYGSPVSAMRWRAAVFWALSLVMIISSRRVGPRLPA